MTLGNFFSSITCYRPSFSRKGGWGDRWSPDATYQGTSHCGLCRLHFPPKPSGTYDDPATVQYEAWQYRYRGLVCEDPTGESKQVQITEVMSGTPFTDHISIKPPRSKKKKLKRFVPTEVTTYCVHEWCYVAFLHGAKGCPKSMLYRLVRSLSFQQSPWQNDYRDRQARSLWGRYPGTDDREDLPASCLTHAPKQMQPYFLAALPLEIRTSIWRYAYGSAYAAFLSCAVEAAGLARTMRRAESRVVSLRRETALLTRSVNIFDTSYLQWVDVPPLRVEEQEEKIEGIQFVACQGGICMLRPYAKEWQGEWVGSPPARRTAPMWYGRVESEEGKFTFVFSDLNLVQITTDESTKESSKSDVAEQTKKPKQIVWDRHDYPSSVILPDPCLSLFDYDPQRTLDDAAPERQPYSHVRMFKYLPFTKGGDYMTGLSVYCGTDGGDDGLRVTGIEAHFATSSQLSGSDQGMATYVHFSPGEKIAYLWLRSCGDPWGGYIRPSLAIQSTLGKRYHFGPYLTPDRVEDDAFDPYWWIRLESKGHIRGLYYEQPIHNPYFRSIGIVSDEQPLRLSATAPVYHHWPTSRCPRWIGTPDKDLYISTCYLQPLEAITICRVGERCIGMMIRFSAIKTSVLGQWKQAGRAGAVHNVLFESKTRQEVNLYFQMKRYYPRENSTATTISHIVTDIGVSTDGKVELLSGRDYRAFGPGEEMAWWWTDKYDLLKNSSGEMCDVPEGKLLRQKAFDDVAAA